MADNQEKLVSISSGHKTMVIEVYPGYSTAQIIALLNMREAMIQGDEIVSWPEPPSEGFYPMCKILEQNDETEHGKWQLSDEKSHGQCCAVLSQEERDRNFANSIVRRSHGLIGQRNFAAAQALIDAAKALLEVSGGRQCDAGIWAVTAQAILTCERDSKDAALPLFEQACDIARQTHGNAHPATIVTEANLGETLIDVGRPEAGRRLLQDCRTRLESTEPVGDYNAEYLKGVLANIDEVLSRSGA